MSTSYAYAPRPRCRHCATRAAQPRQRRLCRRCYDDPAIRRLYPTTHRTAPPERHPSRPAPPPSKPTDALPGGEEKVRVMIERAARREQLFHPGGDAERDPTPAEEAAARGPGLSADQARALEPRFPRLARFGPIDVAEAKVGRQGVEE